jgi:hypothetical protein
MPEYRASTAEGGSVQGIGNSIKFQLLRHSPYFETSNSKKRSKDSQALNSQDSAMT